ncbi:hypothetical protein J2Z48_002990 [Croceifilum oryzae]|uniref:Uncharacterized protein n=1 Tax=Croceifilum oryzae TaxID=1553429 RepID=A0AAJ1TQS2_9BACL|nr:hypothetical protein [Croceifilum oryzae]MDQ0418786.1 hypothetical protein [Croceifilum oryzae]
MKKLALWNDLLIDQREIEEVYALDKSCTIIEGIPFDHVTELNERLKVYEEQHAHYSMCNSVPLDVDDFLKWEGFEEHEFTLKKPTVNGEPLDDFLLYCDLDSKFYYSGKLEISYVYRWFNGDEWKYELYDTITEEIMMETSEDCIILEGKNQQVYKVFTMDEENVKVRDTYLITFKSDCPREHISGKVLEKGDLKKHLTELGCNVDEYMKSIFRLGREQEDTRTQPSQTKIILTSYDRNLKINHCDLQQIITKKLDYATIKDFLDEYTYDDVEYIRSCAEDAELHTEWIKN